MLGLRLHCVSCTGQALDHGQATPVSDRHMVSIAISRAGGQDQATKGASSGEEAEDFQFTRVDFEGSKCVTSL